MIQQVTNTVLMIRPLHFRMNTQTAETNYFQQQNSVELPAAIQTKALKEFDALVLLLRSVGVTVIVIDDTNQFDTPDALFPNNWISFHQNGTVVLFPMLSKNRRNERREDILDILEQHGFLIENVVDYTSAEEEGYFLEGTGSLVLDRIHQKAYAALSPRTDEELALEFCEDLEYTPVFFTANQNVDSKRAPIYHTNVLLSIGSTYAVVCLNAIDDKKERKQIMKHLKADGKHIIAITQDQVQHFAGNILQVLGFNGKAYIVLSTQAFNCLTLDQKTALEKHGELIHTELQTIEKNGGGSARCMLAEIFLPTLNRNEAN